MDTSRRSARLRLITTVPVWIVTVVGAVIVGVTVDGDDFLIWLPLVLGLSILLTFFVQLATREKDGLVERTMFTLSGSIVILGVATAILALASR